MFTCSWSVSAIETPDAHLVSCMFWEHEQLFLLLYMGVKPVSHIARR